MDIMKDIITGGHIADPGAKMAVGGSMNLVNGIVSGVTGLANLASMGYNIYAGERDYNTTKDQWERAFGQQIWENEIMRQREDKAIQRQANDLAAAGINPLIAGQLMGAKAGLGGVAGSGMMSGQGGAQAMTQMLQEKRRQDEIERAAEKQEQQKDEELSMQAKRLGKEIEMTDKQMEEIDQKIKNMTQEEKLSYAQTLMMYEQLNTEKRKAVTDVLNWNIQRKTAAKLIEETKTLTRRLNMLTAEEVGMWQNILGQMKDRQLKDEQIKQIQAQTLLVKSEKDMKELEKTLRSIDSGNSLLNTIARFVQLFMWRN